MTAFPFGPQGYAAVLFFPAERPYNDFIHRIQLDCFQKQKRLTVWRVSDIITILNVFRHFYDYAQAHSGVRSGPECDRKGRIIP